MEIVRTAKVRGRSEWTSEGLSVSVSDKDFDVSDSKTVKEKFFRLLSATNDLLSLGMYRSGMISAAEFKLRVSEQRNKPSESK